MVLPIGHRFHKRRKGIGKGSVMETKALKKQLGAAIAMVLVAAIALGAATFAWFVNNNAVTATGVDVSTSSAVPNLYITSTGQTTGTMTPAEKNPTKLYPVSTNDANNFYETKHWTTDNVHALADEYQLAIKRDQNEETKEYNNVYADYTFELGVSNGKMNVYFDSSNVATTLAANTQMGTAGRFAIKFGDGNWTLFKVKGTATANGYYTDEAATENKDYWVTGAGDSTKVLEARYADMTKYSGSVDGQGQVQIGEGVDPLATIDSTQKGGKVTVTVRVWYEGCDKDCVSENALTGIEHAIQGNLGFVGVQTA